MPITQERMIKVLKAAKSLEATNAFIESAIMLELEHYSRETQSTEQTHNNIIALLKASRPSVGTLMAIEREANHFQTNARKNDSERGRQKRRRQRQSGTLPQKIAQHNPGGSNKGNIFDAPLGNALDEAVATAGVKDIAAYAAWVSGAANEGTVETTTLIDKKTGDEITRTVIKGVASADPNAPPPSVSLDDDTDGGIL